MQKQTLPRVYKNGESVIVTYCNIDAAGKVINSFECNNEVFYTIQFNNNLPATINAEAAALVVMPFRAHNLIKVVTKIPLTEDYTAEVSKDEVVVGCQRIPIAKIREVLAAAEKMA